MYYEVKVRYDRIQEDGAQKKTTENYLVSTSGVTEAEEAVTKELAPTSPELDIKSVKQSPITEVINHGQEPYYRATLGFTIIDEKNGKEKLSTSQILIGAASFADAYGAVNEAMRGTVSDWKPVSLSESNIVGVIQ